MNFGLLKYSTRNLGDEIQSLAARQFLPRVDTYIDRDFLNEVDNSEAVKIILNGWFTHRPENWPPAPQLQPLFISFHLSHAILPRNVSGISPAKRLLEGASLEYLQAHSPIGCRDIATMELLESRGVRAFFSGCLTLTLENPNPHEKKEDLTYCVEVSEAMRRFVAAKTVGRVVVGNHHADLLAHQKERFHLAETLLCNYARAKLVVTSKLHCALPCLALGTPVLFVDQAPDHYRFTGLLELMRSYKESEIFTGATEFDWESPEPNPVDISPLRYALIDRCRNFIGTVRNREIS